MRGDKLAFKNKSESGDAQKLGTGWKMKAKKMASGEKRKDS